MVPMQALVGFNLHGVVGNPGSPCDAPSADIADKLEAAGVAERPKADEKPKTQTARAPADRSTGAKS